MVRVRIAGTVEATVAGDVDAIAKQYGEEAFSYVLEKLLSFALQAFHEGKLKIEKPSNLENTE